MATVSMYSFSKRYNSTAAPEGDGSVLECTYKNGCNVTYSPILLISAESIPWNYCKLNGRWFFINSVTSVRQNLWELNCSVDVLATQKDLIVGSSAYVLYSTVSGNSGLVDRRIPHVYSETKQTSEIDVLSNFFDITGRYILSAVGEDGGVDTWCLTASQFNALLNNIQEYQALFDPVWPDEPEFTDDFIQNIWLALQYLVDITISGWKIAISAIKNALSFSSAVDCIRSCLWMPFVPSGLSSGEITLGGYHTGITANRVATEIQQELGNISIPWQAGDWRRSSPYHELNMYIPFVGVVNLPASSLVNSSTLTLRQSLSTKTGELAFELMDGNSVISTYGGTSAVSIPIGTSNVSPVQAFNSITQGISSVMTIANEKPGGIGGLISAVEGGLTPNTQSVGGIGNSAGSGLSMKCVLTSIFHNTCEPPTASSAIRGIPCYATRAIPSSGYVQTSGYSFAGNITEQERTLINTLMDGGVYIE